MFFRRAARHASIALAAALLVSAGARADEPEDRHVAVGARAGLLPPVFLVAELIVRPVPHAAFGAFGIGLPARSTIGGELLLETAAPSTSTLYARAALLRYVDHGQPSERATIGYMTAGYEWKLEVGLELELGAGVLFFLSEEREPCGAWCVRIHPPPAFPTLDLGVRASFL